MAKKISFIGKKQPGKRKTEKVKKLLRKIKNKELTEEGKNYNESSGNILQDFLDDGYKKSDIIKAINYCAELESFDQGDEIKIFLEGINYGRKKLGKK